MNRILDVYLNGALVGKFLQTKYGRLEFTYTKSWLSDEDSVPLSWSLPLRQEAFNQKECRGFFAGILPEEANRDIIARILGISSKNDYAMLEKIGGECAGAITFLLENEPFPEGNYSYKKLSEQELAVVLSQLPNKPLLAGEEEVRISLAGAQNKIAVYMDKQGNVSLPLGGAPSTHIIKPAIDRFPNIVSNEALCLKLAKAVGIPAVDVSSGKANGSEYLLVKRYDRIVSKGVYPARLHQEDFCQAFGMAPERKYQSEGGPSLKACFALVREASTLPAVSLQSLLNMVIFNIIVGNHDAHGKNFSLLFHRGQVGLAPAYDILSTVHYPELTSRMAMKIGKKYESNRLTLKDFEHFAKNADLSFPLVKSRITKIAEKVVTTLPGIKREFPLMIDLINTILKRAETLLSLQV